MEKNINQISFYFVEEGPGRGSEDIKKDCNINCFDFFFSVFLMDVMGGKIAINLKEILKEVTCAHWKRAGSALSRERTLCNSDAPQVGSARSDSTRVVKVNHHKTNCHKTRPYCIWQLKQ